MSVDASRLGAEDADLVVMTGHAAQEIIADGDWAMTLAAAHRALQAGGHLAFETRDPARRAWEAWTPERTLRRLEHPTLGGVDVWYRLVDVRRRPRSVRGAQPARIVGEHLVAHRDDVVEFSRDANSPTLTQSAARDAS